MSKLPPPPARHDARVRPLSDAAASSVRSGQVIGSLSRAVEELVRNAASAGAGRIIVTVGGNGNGRFGAFDSSSSSSSSSSMPYLQVSDDGIGIDPESLERYVGTEHCSSRRMTEGTSSQSVGLFAERGESLKSIAALSVEMLVATSNRCSVRGEKKKRRTSEQIVTCEKVIRESVAVSFRSSNDQGRQRQAASASSVLPSSVGTCSILQEHQRPRPSFVQAISSADKQTGTTITIVGLFHRYAVRRRHREMDGNKGDAVAASRSERDGAQSSSERADLGQVRGCLRTMALAYPLITFRLMNGRTGAMDSSWEALSTSKCSEAKSLSTTPRFDPSLPLSSSFSARRGGLQGLPSDTSIMISSLSHRLKQHCGDASSGRTTVAVVYEEEEASSSAQTKNAWAVVGALSFDANGRVDANDDKENKRTTRTRQHELIFVNERPARHGSALADIVQNELSSFLSHHGDKNAYFILHVTCSAQEVDVIIDENKSMLAVPQRKRMERLLRKAVSSTLKRNGYDRRNNNLFRSEAFDVEQNLPLYHAAKKRSRFDSSFDSIQAAVALPVVGSVASSKFVQSEVIRTSHDSSSLQLPSSPYFTADASSQGSSEHAPTTSDEVNPKASPFSDAFFGQTLAVRESPNVSFDDAFFSTASSAEPAVAALSDEADANDPQSENIPVSDDNYDRPSEVSNWTRTRVRALESQISSLAVNINGGVSNRRRRPEPIALSKEMLAKSQVIAQVDDKFIVINAGGGLLCIVDQHAADERVGLERLERRLLAETSLSSSQQQDASKGEDGEPLLKSVPLLPAQSIRLSSAQLAVVVQHKELLEKWRFTFKLPSADNDSLLLNGVPGICDKIATRQDFSQYIQALESRTSDAGLVKPAFVKRVLASRACRFAIMFGDVLSHEQCEELIKNLSECDLAFICAHGRPSVAPLLDIRDL